MQWLEAIPPVGVYLIVMTVIGLQFVCLPSPGGVALTTAALLAVRGHVDPWLVGAGAVAGVLLGSVAGYGIGLRGGRPAVHRLTRRFPRALSARNVEKTTASFERWGAWVVVVSCFAALPRMLAAPLSGTLTLPFWRFLSAMSASAVLWAGGTTAAVYYVGLVAESWINRLSGVSLAALAVAALASLPLWRRRPKDPA